MKTLLPAGRTLKTYPELSPVFGHTSGYIFFPVFLFFILLSLCLPGRAGAQNYGRTFDSVAAPQNYRTPGVNPAALSYGTGHGIGYALGFNDEGFTEDFDFFINMENFAYQLHGTEGVRSHTLAFSFSPLRNLYFGSSVLTDTWKMDQSDYTLGLLFRPRDYLSFGGRSDFISGEEWDVDYRVGIGVRPLAFTPLPAHALTVTGDLPVTTDGIEPPAITTRIEPYKGLEIGFGYDMENRGLFFEAALSLFNIKSGVSTTETGGQTVSDGRGYVHSSPRPFNRPRTPDEDLLYQFSLDRPIMEAKSAAKLGDFYLLSNNPTIYEVSQKIKDLAQDPLISGIVFINENPATNYVHLLELKEALHEFKSEGKKVIFFSEKMSSLNYILAASTADAIYLSPTGMIDLKGISISSPYLDSFLEKWGVDVENFRSSKYKSGYDFLSEPEMREEEREAHAAVIDDLYTSIKTHIEEGRGSSLSRSVEEIIRSGPYLLGERALEEGLVDELIYRDQLEETIPFYDNTVIEDEVPFQTVRSDWSDPPSGKVALINAVGSIHTGEGVPGESIGSETLTRSIKEARENSSIDAILLRVHSGGGSVIASDAIAREVELCRDGPNAKPLVVSMGGTAASGGYYISSYADTIISYPTTITGSIGVVSLFPNIEKLLQEQEIAWDVVKSGDHADFGSIYRTLSEEEKRLIRNYIDSTYRTFISTVAEGRDMDTEEVDNAAKGRIWTGNQAKERGLVDRTGCISDALDVIREKAELPESLEIIDYTFAGGWGTIPLDNISGRVIELLSSDRRPYSMYDLAPHLKPMADYIHYSGDEDFSRPLYLMPYHVPGYTD
ncbi:MAG: signal peptide peptidase SppA [Spirochaetia bacterium]